jgi:uncharacterized protein YqeY
MTMRYVKDDEQVHQHDVYQVTQRMTKKRRKVVDYYA